MAVYYIPIPKDKDEKIRLGKLIQGLEPYYGISVSQVLQVRTEDMSLDSILGDLAINVIGPNGDGDPDPEPKAEDKTPVAKKTGKKSARKGKELQIYEIVETGEKMTTSEMTEALKERTIDNATHVRHSHKGLMYVIAGDRGLELVEAKNKVVAENL